MDLRGIDGAEEEKEAGASEDVAVLYSWANLHETKYRDFSASRREYRAQMRRRAAEQQREKELKAEPECVSAAAASEATAREAEEAARRASYEVQEAQWRAAAKRIEAHVAARRQAAWYAESETRRREQAEPQPGTQVPGAMSNSYTPESQQPTQMERIDHHLHAPASAAELHSPTGISDDLLERMGSIRSSGAPSWQIPSSVSSREMRFTAPVMQESTGPARFYAQQDEKRVLQSQNGLHDFRSRQEMSRSTQESAPLSSVADTLQHSREHMAARWFVLKSVFEHAEQHAQPEAPPARRKELRTPMLAVFSLAGGVGKTSLVATLGRALSSLGEKVLLADTASHSLLPFYFGASELRPDALRTFLPPSGSTDTPIYLLNSDLDQKGSDQETQDWLAEELTRNSRGMQRILMDLTGSSGWVAHRMARMSSTVLVPVAPDMNSVISLQAVEKFFADVTDVDGRQVRPFYLLNQFDAGQPLHLDVREVLGQQLGERLLPCAIRRAPSVSEALAEGMTVMDYAPDAAVSDDYRNIASWLRAISIPATAGQRNLRWSER
jgi:cellulose synthase operon protein YhjQ